jgi:hypothetical protein
LDDDVEPDTISPSFFPSLVDPGAALLPVLNVEALLLALLGLAGWPERDSSGIFRSKKFNGIKLRIRTLVTSGGLPNGGPIQRFQSGGFPSGSLSSSRTWVEVVSVESMLHTA